MQLHKRDPMKLKEEIIQSTAQKHEMVYRTLGASLIEGRLGCGFMQKHGRTADWAFGMRPEYSLVYVLSGNGEYIDWDTNRYPVKAGDIFQRFPGKKHSTVLDPQSNWEECFIAFGPTQFAAVEAMGLISHRPVLEGNGIIDELFVKKFNDCMIALKTVAESLLPRTLPRILDILVHSGEIVRAGSDRYTHAEMIDTACRLLRETMDKRQTLEDVADTLGVGYEKFRKIFREAIGISPGEYRVRRRVEHGQLLLLHDKKSVKEVAEILGYPSSYAFSDQFKRIVGVSPGRFRRNS